MEQSKFASRLPILPLLIAVSLFVGCLIPWFYAWTDSDQSRPSPLLWKVPLGAAVASVAFCLALPWLPIKKRPSKNAAPPSQMRFSLRMLLILTTGVAVAIALLAKFPVVVSGIACVGAFVSLIVFCVRNRQHRMAVAALVACMTLPYAWVVGYQELGQMPVLVLMFAGMPAFAPAVLLGQLFGQNMHTTPWLPYLLTAFEIAGGIWVIRLGPKPTIAYLLLVVQFSVLGSLFFYMLLRLILV